MEILLALSVAALIIILLIVKSVLNKDTKDLKISFGFLKGFEFSCSFFDNLHIENH